MIKRHTTFYVNKVSPIDLCGKTVMWQMDLSGAYELPFETEPTTGEHDFNSCSNCQENLKELIEQLTKKFEGTEKKQGFPFCCPYHSNLTKLKEFIRDSFIPVPEMVARKIIYTNQHIKNNYNTENYYKDITDYIDYTVVSFGQMPGDCGEPLYLSDYFFCVTDLLQRNSKIPKEKKNRLLEFLEVHQTPNENPEFDLNILLNTYQKWLKIFPFEISYYTNLKPHFEKQLPILNGRPEVNKYLGHAKVKMHTKSSLVEILINTTKSLLDKINIPELRKNGAITDIQATQLEFSEASLKTKAAEITKKISKVELKYIKALKNWLQIHKEYFNEITPLLKALPPQQANKIKPELPEKSISFNSPEIIEKLFAELQGYFPEKKSELLKALKGEHLDELLLFPHNQNKFVEVFKRVKYNGYLLSTPTEIRNWICANFTYRYKKGNKTEVKNFNTSTVWDLLTKDKDVSKKERICITDWLPYKSHLQRQREGEKEKI